jgi:hypothetical protein
VQSKSPHFSPSPLEGEGGGEGISSTISGANPNLSMLSRMDRLPQPFLLSANPADYFPARQVHSGDSNTFLSAGEGGGYQTSLNSATFRSVRQLLVTFSHNFNQVKISLTEESSNG